MYVQRKCEKKVTKYLRTREIIAIVGPRQCGKTTLLRHIFDDLQNAVYLDFEERENLELFEEDIDSFVQSHVKNHDFLFIDEFQYAGEGGKKLKYIFDRHEIKIIISGSSSSELTIKSLQYLVGRVFVFHLYPFSFEEFLSYKNEQVLNDFYYNPSHSGPIIKKINSYLDEFMLFGGYPRVTIADDDEEKRLVLKNIYDTYFLKEIKTIFNLASDFKLSRILNALALQVGGIVNYNELSALVGMNYQELLKHLNVLQKTFITVESRPFFTNKRTELVKSPKIFFIDNGLRNAVIKNFQLLKKRTDSGSLRENFAASELIKKDIDLRYWRSKSKAEVDFVIEQNGAIIPVEIKSALLKPQIPRSFASFIAKYQPEKAYIACEALFADKMVEKTEIHWPPLYHVPTILK